MQKLIAALTVLILTCACGVSPNRQPRLGAIEAQEPALAEATLTAVPAYTATKLPTATQTQAPTETPTTEPSATPIPTETATSTPEASPSPLSSATEPVITQGTGEIVIVTIAYNGSGGKEPDEYVEIRNDSRQPVQLKGWTLQDKAEHVFKFPDYSLEPNQTCRIYTNQVHADTCGFSFKNEETAVWNNGGDCAYLADAAGTQVAKYCY